MSGHSKWANIKRQKAVVDAKKGATYARMSREIIVAAKTGGADPQANFRLRTAIERAKAEGVPNDNIQRAIEKGSGNGAGDQVEELTYEGYGPGGVAIMVCCATDNRNRTAGDIRSTFSKYGGNMGETGCVAWMFKESGEISITKPKNCNEDELMTLVLDSGARDLNIEENELQIFCQANEISSVVAKLEQQNIKINSAETSMNPSTTIDIQDAETAKQLVKLLDILENHDDVQHVYANFEIDNNLLQEILS